jgi:hypothetical protein
MNAFKYFLTILLLLACGVAGAQMSKDQAAELVGVSAGRYLGSAINLNLIRETGCRQYLKTDIDFVAEAKSNIVRAMPAEDRSRAEREMTAFISESGPATKNRNRALIQERLNKSGVTLDACANFIASVFGRYSANAQTYKDTVAQLCAPSCYR